MAQQPRGNLKSSSCINMSIGFLLVYAAAAFEAQEIEPASVLNTTNMLTESQHHQEWMSLFNFLLIPSSELKQIIHRKYRSINDSTISNDITNNFTNTTYITNSYFTATMQNIGSVSTATIATATPFLLYIPGLYGTLCIDRALAHLNANPGAFTSKDIGCACVGNCLPPLAPNPDAANFASNLAQSQTIQRLFNFAPYIALVALMVTIGVGDNLMLLISLIKWLPRSETNMCIASQCIADLIVVTFSPITRTVVYVYGFWIGGDISCRLVFGIRDVSFIASSLTMVIVGIQRFAVICYPLQAKSLVTVSKTAKALAGVWMCAIAIGVWRCCNVTFVPGTWSCIFVATVSAQATTLFVLRALGVYIVPMAVLAFCNIASCVSLKKSLTEARRLTNAGAQELGKDPSNKISDIAATDQQSQEDKRNANRRLKIICMLTVVFIIFLVCWGPSLLMETYTGITGYSTGANSNAYLTFYFICSLSGALNPVLYGIFSRPIRICYKRICCCHAIRRIKLVLPGQGAAHCKISNTGKGTQNGKNNRAFNKIDEKVNTSIT